MRTVKIQYFFLLVTSFFLQAQSVSAQLPPAPSQTKSQQYAWLETDNYRTRQFQTNSSTETRNFLKKSSNLKNIKKFLLSKFPGDVSTVQEVVVSPQHKFILSREKFNGVVSEINTDGRTTVITEQSFLPLKTQILSLSLSPSKDFLVIMLQLNGNIDLSRYVIYDLKSRKIKGNFDGLSYMETPAWNNDYEMVTMHPDSSPRLTSAMYVDLRDMSFKTILNHDVFKIKSWVSVTSKANEFGIIRNHKTGQELQINTHIPFLNAVSETDTNLYYVLHTQTDGTIFRLKKENFATPERFIGPKEGFWLSTIKILGDDILLVNYSRDSVVTLVTYDLTTGQKTSELSLPDNYDVTKSTYNENTREIVLNLSNFLEQTFQVTWSLSNPSGIDFSILPQRFYSAGLEVISRLEYFTAKDGEQIPARVTYLNDTKIDGNNPVYIETYGAFNYISGYLTAFLNPMKLEFLKRGGIVVGTGVRGGAERGYDWYLKGTGIHKATPATDLISIANGLIAKGVTKAERIVSTGVSAGAENVVVAAQLSPGSFGLIIPISGGHDMLNYPQLDRWGPQWYFDYLDPYDAKNFASIFARAALELRVPSPSYPEYFIVCGDNDTRVNKVHSFKLKAVLDEFIDKNVHLYNAKNAGHWPDSSDLHGERGVHNKAIIWARVFDYLKLKF